MSNYNIENVLFQICRQTIKQYKQAKCDDLEQLTLILQSNYQQVKQTLPGISYTRFKYTIALINGLVKERN